MSETTFKLKNEKPRRKGWQCPVCGRGVAPSMSFCDCVPKPIQVVPYYPYYPWYPYPLTNPYISWGSGTYTDTVITDSVKVLWANEPEVGTNYRISVGSTSNVSGELNGL